MITNDIQSAIIRPHSQRQNEITTSTIWNFWPLSKRLEIGGHSWQGPHISSRCSRTTPTYSIGDNRIKSAAESLEKSRNSLNTMSSYDTSQERQMDAPMPYLDAPITIKGIKTTKTSQYSLTTCSSLP